MECFSTFEEALADITNHPEKHQHRTWDELMRCSMVGGILYPSLVDAHPHKNGCDVKSGCCRCGGTH